MNKGETVVDINSSVERQNITYDNGHGFIVNKPTMVRPNKSMRKRTDFNRVVEESI